MARGRLIDKSIYTNLDLADIEPLARYLYIGMIVHADDKGRMKADPRFLKALIFPFDQATRIDSIKSWRDQLVSRKLITLYAADGREYLYHPNWEKWQPLRSDREKVTDCPEPDTVQGVTEIGIPMTDNGIPTGVIGIPMVNQCPPIPNLTKPNLTEPKNHSRFFEEIWQRYPRKDGRKQAYRHFAASVKTEQDCADMRKAMDNYLNSKSVLNGYIKNGSTWFNNWRDWINFKEETVDPYAVLKRKYEGGGESGKEAVGG